MRWNSVAAARAPQTRPIRNNRYDRPNAGDPCEVTAINIFYGGSLFLIIVFVALTVQFHRYVVNVSSAGMPLSPEVILGKLSYGYVAADRAKLDLNRRCTDVLAGPFGIGQQTA